VGAVLAARLEKDWAVLAARLEKDWAVLASRFERIRFQRKARLPAKEKQAEA